MRIKLDLVRIQVQTDRVGQEIHDSGIELHPGDRVAFRLTNSSQHAPVYPTLLYINSRYEMTPLYPREGELVESLVAGKSLQTSVLRVNTKTFGQEQLVAIAVKADGPPVDFSGLSEPTIAQARGDTGRADALKSPLGKLLEQALFLGGATRGMDRDNIEESALRAFGLESETVIGEAAGKLAILTSLGALTSSN